MDTARSLTENLAALLRREHAALGDFLVALADFDRRRLWIELGHSSLFYFLHRELHLSKAAAQYRKVAAELIQEVPGVVEPLRNGRLCLTSIIEAAKVVTPENWEAVLPRFFGLSRREAMEIVAELQPHPAPPTRTIVTSSRTAPTPSAREASAAPSLPLHTGTGTAGTEADSGSSRELTLSEPVAAPAPAVARPAEVVPLTSQERRLHVTVSDRFLRKLEAATDALSHAHPGASPEEILEAGVCGSTRRLELDHIQPLALGGTSTVDNVRVACRPHNLLAARLAFGDEWMNRYTSDPRAPRPATRPPAASSA